MEMKSLTWLSIPVLALSFGSSLHASSLNGAEDGEFMLKAAAISRQEGADAQATAQATRRVEIKLTARSIANDHMRAGQQLADLAKQKGMNVPAGDIAAADDAATGKNGRNAVEPDSARIASLLKANEEAVAIFHQEAVRGMDPDVKRFAQTTLPELQRRLETLRLLQDAYPETSTS
jgi:putative membrane protein